MSAEKRKISSSFRYCCGRPTLIPYRPAIRATPIGDLPRIFDDAIIDFCEQAAEKVGADLRMEIVRSGALPPPADPGSRPTIFPFH